MHWLITNFFKQFFKFFILLIIFILITIFPTKNIIYSIGSTTVLPLMEKLGQNYYDDKDNKNHLKVAVAGGGSTVGANMMIKGLTDIGNISRYPLKEEYNDKSWNNLSTFPIAYDGILIIVNLDKTLYSLDLSIEQLISIYEGKITNWHTIDSHLPDLKITLFNRESGSGTLDSFSNALTKYNSNKKISFSSDCNVINSNTQMIDMLENTSGAIGYAQLAYLDQIWNSNLLLPNLYYIDESGKKNTIFEKKNNENATKNFLVDQIHKSILNPGDVKYYLFWHPLNLIIKTNNPKLKNFIKYIFSKDSIENTEKYGYLPVYTYTNNTFWYKTSETEKKLIDPYKTDLSQIFNFIFEHSDHDRKPNWAKDYGN